MTLHEIHMDSVYPVIEKGLTGIRLRNKKTKIDCIISSISYKPMGNDRYIIYCVTNPADLDDFQQNGAIPPSLDYVLENYEILK